jgi:hypothetical protein
MVYVSKPVWHTSIPLLCVQWNTPDEWQRNCPKHVEFHSKNKFEKLAHLVGFIVRNLTRCTITWTSNFSKSWEGTGLDDSHHSDLTTGWMTEDTRFDSWHWTRGDSRAHRAPCLMCTGGFLGNKWPSRGAHGTPSAKVKNEWSYTSTPAHAFTACCAMNHRARFTF